MILLPEERQDVTASVPDPNLWPNTVSEKTIALTPSPEETRGLATLPLYCNRAMTLFHAASAGAAALSHEVLPSMSVRPAEPRPIWKVTIVPAGQLLPSDRKSTRLNSSHRTISYAVFCL